MFKKKKRQYNPIDSTPRKPQRNPYFNKDERSWFEREVWVLISIVVVMGIGAGYLLFYSPFFRVDAISITGTEYISRDEIQGIVDAYRNERIFSVFPRASYVLFNTEEMKTRLYEQIDNRFALRSVSAEKNLRDGLFIKIEERIPGVAFQTGDTYYYLDEYGFATNVVSPEELNPDFSLIKDVNGQEVTVGDQVISEVLLESMLESVDVIPEKIGHTIDHFEIPPLACKEMVTEAGVMDVPRPNLKEQEREIQERLATGEITVEESLKELEALEETDEVPERSFTVRQTPKQISCNYVVALVDITAVLDNGVRLYFTIDQSITDSLQKMDVALKESDKTLGNLSYIDLRFKDRVYLK